MHSNCVQQYSQQRQVKRLRAAADQLDVEDCDDEHLWAAVWALGRSVYCRLQHRCCKVSLQQRWSWSLESLVAGKHKCKFCDARHDSANDAMIHVVKKHADVTSYKHYDDRDHSRRAVEEPCPQCGAKMMPMLSKHCPCGYKAAAS